MSRPIAFSEPDEPAIAADQHQRALPAAADTGRTRVLYVEDKLLNLELMRGIIDYAGMFPPAGLPAADAAKRYAAHAAHPQAWMLGSLVMSTMAGVIATA